VTQWSAISVDLDSLPHYCRIQGLDEAVLDERARALVGEVAVPRFLELFDTFKCHATFFAIGEDLGEPTLQKALQRSVAQGVEIASHSHAHDYALSRRGFDAIRADLTLADEAIVAAVGVKPRGFRAPGYTLSPALLEAVAALGYAYDSSAFPAAPYYAAKALVMGALQAVGRPSRAILDSPRVLGAPLQPYRLSPKEPYRRGEGPMWELPISVTPHARVPFIGTFALTMPWAWVRHGYRALKKQALLNFELHAIDVLDVSDGVPAALARQQRDLNVKASEKLSRLKQLFGWMRDERELMTLATVARQLEQTV
jgi:hypothetical protein